MLLVLKCINDRYETVFVGNLNGDIYDCSFFVFRQWLCRLTYFYRFYSFIGGGGAVVAEIVW